MQGNLFIVAILVFIYAISYHKPYSFYSHVIWASRSSGVVTFPGIADAYSKAEASGLKEDWDQVHHHITVAATAIDNAASTLQTAASV